MKQILIIFVAVILTGCAENPAPIKLKGERIAFNPARSSLKVAPDARKEPFVLAPQVGLMSWNQIGGTADHYPAHIQLGDKVSKAWHYRAGHGADEDKLLLHTPVVLKDMVYLSNTRGEIHAVDLTTGDDRWERRLKIQEKEHLRVSPGLAATNDVVIASFISGDIYALDAKTGDIAWHTNLAVPLKGAPAVAGEWVIFTGVNNSTYALGTKDGKLKWHHNGIDETLSLTTVAAPALSASGKAVVPYNSGEMYVLDVRSGSYSWHETVSQPSAGELRLQAVAASPVVADDVIYMPTVRSGLSAYHLPTGRFLWKVSVNAGGMPWVSGSVLYVIDRDGNLICINRKLGKVRWVQDLNTSFEEPQTFYGPVLAGGRLFITVSTGDVLTVNPRTGDVLKMADFGGHYSLPPVAVAGTILLYNDDARLTVLK